MLHAKGIQSPSAVAVSIKKIGLIAYDNQNWSMLLKRLLKPGA
jgi:hypothetical protein